MRNKCTKKTKKLTIDVFTGLSLIAYAAADDRTSFSMDK